MTQKNSNNGKPIHPSDQQNIGTKTETAEPRMSKLSAKEKDLIEKIKRGEKRYFSEIVSQYENPIFQYSLRMCGNQADAEDILQETFLNAYRALDSFRGESKLSTWLYKIANNSCLMKRRKSKFAPDQEISLSEVSPGDDIDNTIALGSTGDSPIRDLLNTELKEVLQKIILELPKSNRQAFVLADIQGFSGKEIANILGVTVPSVKSRLHRARMFIREKLSLYLELENQQ